MSTTPWASRGTEIADRFIAHLSVVWDGGILDAPVMVHIVRRWGKPIVEPLVRDGHYIHALPGGYEIVGSLA